MKISAIIQARMSSERLPGKVLKKIGKYKMLEIMIRRLKKANI
jgi:spore coat polysaccharide biosynthesis protein SpsF (cytidylyltransferase family)